MFNLIFSIKSKQLKVTKSISLLSDDEMKFVIGGAGLDPISEGGTSYVGTCVGEYTYVDPGDGNFRLMCRVSSFKFHF